MTGGRCPYARLTTEERARTLDAVDALVDAAADAIATGFHPVNDAHEVLWANARQLGVYVWPTLAKRIVADARYSMPSPLWAA